MAVVAAGEEVRTWETHEGDLCAVDAATYRDDNRLDAELVHRIDRVVDDERILEDLVTHVEHRIVEGNLYGSLAVLRVQEIGDALKLRTLVVVKLHLVITIAVVHLRDTNLTLDTGEVDKALTVLCVCRYSKRIQHAVELDGYVACVQHTALCVTGMCHSAVDGDICETAVEVIIVELTLFAAVQGVREVRIELLEVEVGGTLTDLLITGEAELDCAVTDGWVGGKDGCELHDLCNAGLIIGTEKGRTIADDEILALINIETWELLRTEDDVLFLIQDDVLSIVVLDDAWLDVVARQLQCSIHVRCEADRRNILCDALACRDGGINSAVLIHLRRADAHLLQLGNEKTS